MVHMDRPKTLTTYALVTPEGLGIPGVLLGVQHLNLTDPFLRICYLAFRCTPSTCLPFAPHHPPPSPTVSHPGP